MAHKQITVIVCSRTKRVWADLFTSYYFFLCHINTQTNKRYYVINNLLPCNIQTNSLSNEFNGKLFIKLNNSFDTGSTNCANVILFNDFCVLFYNKTI